jgi:hypothetical protein
MTLGSPGGPWRPGEVSGTSGTPGHLRETVGSSRDVRTDQIGPGKPLGHPRKPTSQGPALDSLGHPDVPGASPGLLGVSYACPDVPRPTLTSHHITRPIGLCWPRYLNEVTTCHLKERTNSFYSLVSARSRLPRAGHSSWLHGRAKSRAVDEAVFVGRSPHMPFLSCRGFALSPGTGGDTRDPKTVKNVCRSNLLHITDQRRRCSRHETHNQLWSRQSQHNWLPVRSMQKKHSFSKPSEGH